LVKRCSRLRIKRPKGAGPNISRRNRPVQRHVILHTSVSSNHTSAAAGVRVGAAVRYWLLRIASTWGSGFFLMGTFYGRPRERRSDHCFQLRRKKKAQSGAGQFRSPKKSVAEPTAAHPENGRRAHFRT